MSLNILMMSNSHHPRKGNFFNETYLWHLQLNHINPTIIYSMVKKRILNSLIFESMSVCESCLESKMIKRPFEAKVNHATK